jgi:hypothetical protein
VTGVSRIGGICGSYRYSIIEEMGFFNHITATHELGHKYNLKLYVIEVL